MTDLPIRTVTFLFTDLAESTPLWLQAGSESYQQSIALGVAASVLSRREPMLRSGFSPPSPDNAYDGRFVVSPTTSRCKRTSSTDSERVSNLRPSTHCGPRVGS